MAVARELCFGELALRLEPRALVATWAGPATRAGAGEPRARVCLSAEALHPAERAELEHLAGRDAAAGLVDCPEPALREAAGASPLAALLLATHENATAAPGPPRLMGVVNVTPDSFSDGGRYLDPERATAHGLELAAAGAALLDVGGESTRPGAAEVPAAEELERVLPVVAALAERAGVPVAVDTRKAAVARAALDAGASVVNDVSAGLHDPDMLPLVAERGCEYVAMHMRGRPATMQRDPRYGDAVAEVTAALRRRVAECLKAGLRPSRITLDPGIGFGKRLSDNLDLLRRLGELRSLGRPLLLGVSRKSFLGQLTGEERPERRTAATAAAVTACILGGAEILRVHDVAAMADVLRVAAALRTAPLPDDSPTREAT